MDGGNAGIVGNDCSACFVFVVVGSRPTASHFLCQQLSFRVLLTPLTYIQVGNKETNERKSRPNHCAP